jgi:hypothetical protein
MNTANAIAAVEVLHDPWDAFGSSSDDDDEDDDDDDNAAVAAVFPI